MSRTRKVTLGATGAVPSSSPPPSSGPVLWNGWDPNSLTSPPDITLKYVDWTNTGVPPGTTLTSVAGDFVTSSNGQVVDALDIAGKVTINHTGVIFKRLKVKNGFVKGTIGNDRSTKIWACEIGRADPQQSRAVGLNVFAEVKRCNIYGFLDIIHLTQSTAPGASPTVITFRDNFVHSPSVVYDPGQDTTPPTEVGTPNSHTDMIQLDVSGTNTDLGWINFHHNTFYGFGFDNQTAGAIQVMTNVGGYYKGPNWGNYTGVWTDPTSPAAPSNGRITSLVIINGGTTAHNIDFYNNLVLGKPYDFLSHPTSAADNVTFRSNVFGYLNGHPTSVHQHSLPAAFGTWTGNTGWNQTGVDLTRSGLSPSADFIL